jgi:hypothetical protein
MLLTHIIDYARKDLFHKDLNDVLYILIKLEKVKWDQVQDNYKSILTSNDEEFYVKKLESKIKYDINMWE